MFGKWINYQNSCWFVFWWVNQTTNHLSCTPLSVSIFVHVCTCDVCVLWHQRAVIASQPLRRHCTRCLPSAVCVCVFTCHLCVTCITSVQQILWPTWWAAECTVTPRDNGMIVKYARSAYMNTHTDHSAWSCSSCYVAVTACGSKYADDNVFSMAKTFFSHPVLSNSWCASFPHEAFFFKASFSFTNNLIPALSAVPFFQNSLSEADLLLFPNRSVIPAELKGAHVSDHALVFFLFLFF